MDRRLLEEVLTMINEHLRISQQREEGFRFLLGAKNRLSTRTGKELSHAVAQYYSYNAPWITLQEALRTCLESHSLTEPDIIFSQNTCVELKNLLEEGELALRVVNRSLVVGGDLYIE